MVISGWAYRENQWVRVEEEGLIPHRSSSRAFTLKKEKENNCLCQDAVEIGNLFHPERGMMGTSLKVLLWQGG